MFLAGYLIMATLEETVDFKLLSFLELCINEYWFQVSLAGDGF